MVSSSNRELINDLLVELRDGLGPVVERVLSPLVPTNKLWTAILEERDRVGGRPVGRYSRTDLQSMLSAMTGRLGTLGYPFSPVLGSRANQLLPEELRKIRNDWAHMAGFSDDETDRAFASGGRLLRAVGASEQADRVELTLNALRRARYGSGAAPMPTRGGAVPSAPTVPGRPSSPASQIPFMGDAAPSPSGQDSDAASVTIEVDALDVLSYAMAHNRVVPVSRIDLTSTVVARGAEVTVALLQDSGPIGEPQSYVVDLVPGETTSVPLERFPLDGAAMLSLESQRPGHFEFKVSRDGRLLGQLRRSVDLLAAQQWTARPLELGLEMLAAHVTPHHPDVHALMSEAADVLGERTGDPSLNAYQQDDERTDAIVQAFCIAMQNRSIRYANPPASWTGDGQIVRTADEVLVDRLGTCLDTTVVLASALEEAGVFPLLVVVQGHAFLGYFRGEESFGVPVASDVNEVVNAVDLGLIGLIETTRLTDADPLDFDGMRRDLIARRFRGTGADGFLGAVDVIAARRLPVLALPVRSVQLDGSVTVVEYRPIAAQLPAREAMEGRHNPSDKRNEPARVTAWKSALLDLSLRNRLLNFTDSQRLPLLLPEDAAAEVENQLNAGKTLTLVPNDKIPQLEQSRGARTAADLSPDKLIARLRSDRTAHVALSSDRFTPTMRRLANSARVQAEETGANNLYLAVGSLLWNVKGKPIRSPLILIPVSLKARARGDNYQLTIDESGGSTPNFCLIEKLWQEAGIRIPALENPDEDESGIDIDATLRNVRLAIQREGLPFQVEASLDLAILQFAKFRLWKDMDEHWSMFAKNPLVGHLLNTPNMPFQEQSTALARDLDELAALVPVSADASQLTAVGDALAGRTFVLEGPPGTGKSQTITNLLARAIAEGKRVLFVAEKRAALEVVQRRLTAVGLAPFALDLHDKASRLNELRRHLREALDASTGFDRDRLDAANANARRTGNSLNRYAQRVHSSNSLGLSLYGARLRELSYGREGRPIELDRSDVQALSQENVTTIVRALEGAPDTTLAARPHREHGWEMVTDEVARTLPETELQQAADALDAAIIDLENDRMMAAAAAVTVTDELRAAAKVLRLPSGLSLDSIERAATRSWREDSAKAIERLRAFADADYPILKTLDVSGLDLPLEKLHHDAEWANSQGFFGRKKRQLAVVAAFGSHLSGDAASLRKTMPTFINAAIAVRLERNAVVAQVQAVPELAEGHGDPFDLTWADRLEAQRAALLDAADRLTSLAAASPLMPSIRSTLQVGGLPNAEAAARFVSLAEAVDRFTGLVSSRGGDVDEWRGDRGWVVAWTSGSADRHATGGSTLHRWYSHLEGLRPLKRLARTRGLSRLYDMLVDGEYPIEDAAAAFELAVAHSSVVERQSSERLTDFDSRLQDRTVDRYRAALGDVQKLLPDALPHQLIGSRRFDAASSAGQVGLLRRQLDRQRGGMSIRALLAEFHELILNTTPCVLVSPESVARFFPAQSDLFDLVVFDEASQVRVADAIGAMGRGRSVVVVGDSKQMPPSTFAMAGGGVDDDSGLTPSGDEESILSECVRAQVTSQRLTWHYRSRHEALIAFSNEHYYDGKLASFPSPRAGADQAPVIDFVPVPGEFLRSGKGKEKRTNPAEASAIVQDIERRFDASPDRYPSVGVVTFNKEQRDLVESMLRDSEDARIGEALDLSADGLFVKNLENVQGDERDAILFSVAFSRNERGDLPLNFGPLTQAGGERRLNVAITRAREQVVLFCSFDPSELRAEQTQSLGIKHLRDYLRLAQQGRPDALAMRRKARADAHRDDVAEALRANGLTVTADVGLSDFRVDLAVASPDDPEADVLAVLLDTPDWNDRVTVHDRDVLPAAVLHDQMGWGGVTRVWLPDWLENRDSVIERVRAAAAQASQQVSEKQQARSTRIDRIDLDLVEVQAGLEASPLVASPTPSRVASASASAVAVARQRPEYQSRFARFVPWTYRGSGRTDVLDQLPRPAATRMVGSSVADIVQQEGPIHRARLVRLAAVEFGLSRVSTDRAHAILRTLDGSFIRAEDGEFAWPAGSDPRTWFEYRWSTQADERDIRRISPVEIANAMRHIAEEGAGIGREVLLREALNRFGSRRVTADVQAHLESALQAGIDLDKLVIEANGTVRSLDTSAAGAPVAPTAVSIPSVNRWVDVLQHVTDAERPLLIALRQLGVPAPRIGAEVGEGIPVAISWPERKVAVSLGVSAADGAELAGLGWKVVRPDARSIVMLFPNTNGR